jgi:hypothetical protein
MDADWILATLNDVMDALEEAIAELESDPDAVDERLPDLMPVAQPFLDAHDDIGDKPTAAISSHLAGGRSAPWRTGGSSAAGRSAAPAARP